MPAPSRPAAIFPGTRCSTGVVMVESMGADASTIETEQQLLDAIGRILGALRDAEAGELSVRIELPYDDSEPLGMLAARVNVMLESLTSAREETHVNQQRLEEQIA